METTILCRCYIGIKCFRGGFRAWGLYLGLKGLPGLRLRLNMASGFRTRKRDPGYCFGLV